MKIHPILLAVLLYSTLMTTNSAAVTPVSPRVIDSELGQALGFYAYRYESDLAADEALVVHELVTVGTRKMEAEYVAIGTGPKAHYDLVIVDSGFFHPSLRNTYMLRFPTSTGSIDDVTLMGHTHGPDYIEFVFADPVSFQVKLTRRWSAAVEKHEDVRKRWPDLPQPTIGYQTGSRRLIADTAPDPANPAAATPVSVSTRRFNVSATSSTAPVQADGLEMLKAGAAKDNVAAQVALAAAYFSGNGVAKDFLQAAHWWRKAAELGDATAQHNLAAMYANGFGVEQDWLAARTWYLKAAAQGDARSQSNLAANYANGRGGPVDMDQAFFWARKAADQGLSASECDLAVMYETGLGVPKDVDQAMVWYRRAANQGDARAQAALNRLSTKR